MGIKENHSRQLEFYITPEHDCPYLKDQKSKTLFLSPEIQPSPKIYKLLIDNGFRRSGDHIYRPHCDNCKACMSVRIPVETFTPTKQQKRCGKNGNKFSTMISPAKFDIKRFELFERYINERHKDGDMYPTSEKQYREFILCEWLNTQFLDLYDPVNGKLIGCLVFDELNSELSAIYSFFDPDFAKYSPGRLLVLNLIALAQNRELPYVHLGYWIKDCQKMSYKGEYRPLDCFVENNWVSLN